MTPALYARVVDSVAMSAWVTLLVGGVIFTVGEMLGIFGRERL